MLLTCTTFPLGKKPGRQGVDCALVDLEQRHVIVKSLVQQDDEFHQVRVGLLPERLLAATEQVIQQADNSVCQRVSFEIVMKGLYRYPDSRLSSR